MIARLNKMYNVKLAGYEVCAPGLVTVNKIQWQCINLIKLWSECLYQWVQLKENSLGFPISKKERSLTQEKWVCHASSLGRYPG